MLQMPSRYSFSSEKEAFRFYSQVRAAELDGVTIVKGIKKNDNECRVDEATRIFSLINGQNVEAGQEEGEKEEWYKFR